MNAGEIINFCMEKGLLLDKEVLEIFSGDFDEEFTKIVLEKLQKETRTRVITKNLFNKNKEKVNEFFLSLPHENRKKAEKLQIKLGLNIEISKVSGTEINSHENEAEDNFKGVKVVRMSKIEGKKLEVKDFVEHFRGRLKDMAVILQERSGLDNLVSINKIPRERQNFSIIGLVYDKRVTKNGNIFFDVEDLTGRKKVLVSKNNKEVYETAQEVSLDSIVGLKVSGNEEILFVNEIVFPDARLPERKKSPVEENVLFIGDLHFGTNLFFENKFEKFIDYLNYKIKGSDKEEIEKIKYIFIVGDLICGVGVYPGQEKELIVQDAEEQYEMAASFLSRIRKDIKLIICPGNHDALRIMEPQPLLDEKYAWPLYNMKNVIMTTNPSLINVGARKDFEGFNVMMYHGYSFHYYGDSIPDLVRLKAVNKSPDKVMHYLLKNRHLAPSHSSTLYFPSREDELLIRDVPDILFSGHTHKSGISYYNNVLTISGSTWESMTPFQEKMGNTPDFCKVPMFNTKTRAVKILDFE